jgi:hypothetical protein
MYDFAENSTKNNKNNDDISDNYDSTARGQLQSRHEYKTTQT